MRLWRVFLARMCLKLEFGGGPARACLFEVMLTAPNVCFEGEGGDLEAPLPFKLPPPPCQRLRVWRPGHAP